jgi:hypothetical protein
MMTQSLSVLLVAAGIGSAGCHSNASQVSAGLEGVCCGPTSMAAGCAQGLSCQPIAIASVGVCMPATDAGPPDHCGALCSADGGTPVTCGGNETTGGPGVTSCYYHSFPCQDQHVYNLDCDGDVCVCTVDGLITASFPVGNICMTQGGPMNAAKCICHVP